MLKRFAVAFLILLLTAGIAELVIRILDPLGMYYFSEGSKYFASMRHNDNYAYIHTLGYMRRLQGVDVSINSHGFRGPEFDVVKSPGKIRVLILGDSVVFGWGAPQNDIFALQLQHFFDRQGLNIEIIPAGVGSWNTRTEYEYLSSTAIDFQPNIFVLMIVSNDVELKCEGHTEVSKELVGCGQKKGSINNIFRQIYHGVVSRSYLLSHIQYFVKIRKAKEEEIQVTADSPQWEDTRLALDRIVKLCHDRNIELFPYLYGSAATVGKTPALNFYKKYFESNDIRFFTLPDTLFESTKYKNSIIDGHPNAAGHAIIAHEIYQQLAPILTKTRV